MSFKNAIVTVSGIDYKDLNYSLQEIIEENIMYPIKDGYFNYIGVEINLELDKFLLDRSDYMKQDLMNILDLTELEFEEKVKSGEEVSFYVDYEL